VAKKYQAKKVGLILKSRPSTQPNRILELPWVEFEKGFQPPGGDFPARGNWDGSPIGEGKIVPRENSPVFPGVPFGTRGKSPPKAFTHKDAGGNFSTTRGF